MRIALVKRGHDVRVIMPLTDPNPLLNNVVGQIGVEFEGRRLADAFRPCYNSFMKVFQLGEFGLIELIKRAQTKRPDTILGIGDDCAVLEGSRVKGSKGPRDYLLITTDSFVENVHFRAAKTSFFDLGYYALFANVSDIISMGGVPTHTLVTVGLPARIEVSRVKALYRGIGSLAEKLKIDVVGGDTVRSPSGTVVSITLLGEVEQQYLLTRAGARPGDLILATGVFGGPAARRYKIRDPKTEIRIREARAIARSKLATAMIDSSDGLARSVVELCRASQAGALIYGPEVPVARGANFHQALHGGEEYELVFTVPVGKVRAVKQAVGKTKLSVVGEVLPKQAGIKLMDLDGRVAPLARAGYEHFRNDK